MEHVSNVLLGQDPDERQHLARLIAERGFPLGAIARCGTCWNQVEMDIDAIAKNIAGRKLECCGEVMEMKAR